MVAVKCQGRPSRCPSVAESGDGGIGTSCSDSTEGDGHHRVTPAGHSLAETETASNPDVWNVNRVRRGLAVPLSLVIASLHCF